ncbi:MAG: HYR domain-containing protein [Saprospiraceae bacterium]|nr:HYR domain-containing protein [Candidatus Defluviibacterium haderslevense]
MATSNNAKAIAPKTTGSSKWQSTLDHAKDGQMIMLPAIVNEVLTVKSSVILMTSGSTVLKGLIMDAPGKKVKLLGDLTIDGTLELGKGILDAGTYRVKANLTTAASANSYILLLPSGSLTMSVAPNTTVNFPIGTGMGLADVDVIGNPSHVTDNITMSVVDAANLAAFTNVDPVGPRFAEFEWDASEAVAGGSNLNFIYRFPTDPHNVKTSKAVVGHNTASVWTYLNTTISGVGPYSTSSVGPYTSFSPFGVFGTMPVHNITLGLDYATIQSAIDAANPNDIILCDAATYTESINIHKAVTLRGANFGIPGIGGRAAEAILLNCTIDINNAGNTTIDGFHILRNDGNTGPTNQIELDGGGVSTVQNCILERNGSNTGQAIRALATTTAGGNKIITNNKIFGDASGGLFSGHKSWNNGIYIDQGPFTVSVTGNTILNCRSGLNIDDMNNSVTISGNTINNNGTHISFGAVVPTTGSFVLGSNDFINNVASTMINLSNVNANFRLDITSSTLSGVAFNALTNTQLFDVEARMAHKEVSASKKGKVIYLTNKQYVNNFTVPITKIDKIQNSINYGDAGDTIYLEDGTYNEKLIIDRSNLSIQGVTGNKTLYIIDGTTQGTTSGIVLNNGMTNITIKNLTVQKFTGASGNANAGIYGIGGNNNLKIDSVALLDNPTASGFYANGPVDNVIVTNSMVVNNGGGARGIVLWNGLKTNINFSNNMVTNNTCCGIELSDGNASAVTVSGNTIDIGGGDNAIGLIGLNNTTGNNLIQNNIITGGGRFGIEIKNPAGGVTVSGNTVTLTTLDGNAKDRAGIAVFRRSVGPGNVDVPNGVTVTGNTVDGYVQTLPEEGFGIVIEGTNHTVTGNTIKNSNIGIQQQGGAHPNANYPAGDGNQDAGFSANYFGRGNAPFACGNTISGNTFVSNTTDTRNVLLNSYGLVTNTTTNLPYCNIQAAVSDALTLNGHVITVSASTYPEQITVNKQLDIRGPNFGIAGNGSRVAEAIIVPPSELNLLGVPREWDTTSLIRLNANSIKMDGFKISGDNPLINGYTYAGMNVEAGRGIKSTGNDISFKNNIVEKFTYIGFHSEGGLPTPTYTNLIINKNKFDNIHDLNQLGYGFAIYATATAGAINDNTFTNSRIGIQIQPYQVVQGSNGVSTCSNNTFSIWRQAVYYNYAEVGASAWTIDANTITATLPPVNPTGPVLWEGIRAETMRASSNGGTISNNNVNGSGATTDNVKWWGVWGLNYRGASSTSTQVFFTSNTVSNVELGFVHSAVADIVLTGNTLSGSNKAISIQRDYSSAGVIQPNGGINHIDATGGNTINGVATGAATTAQLYTIEDAINHKIDNVTFGFATVKANHAYVTTNSFFTPNTAPSVQRGIDAVAANGTVRIQSGATYTGGADASAKTVTLAPGASTACVTITGDVILNSGDVLDIEANGTTACTLFDQFIVNGTVTLGGATLNLTLGYSPVNGDQLKIIDNDGVDAVSGQFVQGNVITVGGYTFDINYAGGDGNDVVLTKCAGVMNTTTLEKFCTIQAAIDDPQTLNGHTLMVSTGTFTENVNVTKELTITGAGKGSNPASNTVLMPASSCSGVGFTVSAANVTIQNMYVTNFQDAVLLNGAVNPTINNMALIDYCRYGVTFGGSNSSIDILLNDIQRTTLLAETIGMRVGTANAVNGLFMDGCSITGNALQGIVVFQATTPVAFDAITIQNSTISNNLQKGMYFEKLSNATFDGLTMADNGTDAGYNFNNGIDINLKYNAYSNITIQDCDITNSGHIGTAPDPQNPSAITIKARDDAPSYNTIPASLSNVTIKNNRITGPRNGIRIGEIGKVNATPTNVLIEGNDLSFAFAHKTLISRINSDINVVCNWHGTTDLGVILNTFVEGAGGDILLGTVLSTGVDASGNVGFQPAGTCQCANNNLVTNTNTSETFCDIQSAIDDPQTLNGHTLSVGAGTYVENIIVNKQLTILGPNDAIDPCSGATRVAEAIVVPATAAISSGEIFHVAASNVTIKGFTIDGDNTAITSGFSSTNGADIDAAEGITVYETAINNLTASNNIIKNLSYFGITLYDYPAGVPSSGHTISNNKIQDMGTYDAGSTIDLWGGGVLLYNNQYAKVENNCMTNVRLGVQTGNFHQANPGAATFQRIENNSIQARRRGIFHNLFNTTASPYTITNNTITGLANANETAVWDGILLSSLADAIHIASNNTINGSAISIPRTGISVWNDQTAPLISGGTITGVDLGINVNNFEGYPTAGSNAGNTFATIDGGTITGATIAGIKVNDNVLNTNNATVSVIIKGNTIINNTTTGLWINGGDATLSFSGATPASFLNQTTYIDQTSNGTNAPSVDIDATAVLFDGQTGLTGSFAQLFTIENKINHKIDWKALGFVTVKANNNYVTDINAGQSSTNNDYTRIRNGVEIAQNNWNVNLKGSFDWTEANASSSWALGNDGVVSPADDYSILVPANRNGITFTAPEGLGTASITGPGDLAAVNLEGVLFFDGGDNQNWTISNMEFKEFDLSIYMGNGAGGTDAFNNTTITNNTFNIATDLNAVTAPADVNQNIGLHYSFGTNQTISNNTFNIPGDGVSNGTNYSSSVAMQSNTSGGAVYNGLSITGNTINIINAQSANPQLVLGIWENAHAHSSTINVTNNQFLNLAGGNNSALNLQRAFRVTSHSSGGSTVTYSGNTVKGANIGLQWIAASNFSAEQPVLLTSNILNGNDIGILVQSNGKALLTTNDFDDATDNNKDVQIQPGSIVTTGNGNQFAGNNYYIENLSSTGINISGDLFDETNNFRRTDRIYGALDNAASGLIRFNGSNLYVSTPGTGSSDESIPNAIAAAAASGDIIHIETGTYATGADATSKEVTFAPGSSPGCVTLTGNMVLTSGDALAMEINGTTVCTLYDKFIVLGTVTLGGSNLAITLGFAPASGDQFTIIENDGVDAVIGQFVQGGTITVGGVVFDINYVGGDGNDVVLTACGSGKVHNGVKNYCTIQDAINDAIAGDVITVDAGTYAENVIVNKSLTILGPNSAIDPCSGATRVAEAIIVPATSAIASGEIFHVAASNVTISGFTIDGDNTSITTGKTSTNGADIDAAEGITVYETAVNNVTASNNIIKNLSYFGITLFDYLLGVPSSGHTISNNKIQDLGTYDPTSGIDFWGGGVLLYNNQYAKVENNCMTNVRLGVQTGNFYQANPGASAFQVISGNTIQARRRGIFHNLAYTGASAYTLNNNTITGLANANETAAWDGILLSSLSTSVHTASNNIINGVGITAIPKTGIVVWGTQTAPLISGGTITNVDLGINVNNFEGYPTSGSNSDNTFATISGVTITGAATNGIKVHDNPSNTNGATVFAEIKGNTNVSGSPVGILVKGSDASSTIKDNPLSINGNPIGIDVDGGSATIENNHIYDNGIGVRFINSGSGTVKTNKFFETGLPNGKDLQKAANAGSVVATANNWFSGTTYGVENLSATDVDATLNYWNAANGPGPVGPGSGALITTKVLYCQYLNGIPVPLGGTGVATSPTVTILVTETSGIAPNDGIICNGASATLNATTTGATAYAWSTGATTASIVVAPGTTTTYTVTVTFPGCTVTDDQTITVDPLPSCTITGTNGPVCPNTTNNFDGPAGLSYAWSITGNASISGSNTMQTVTVTSGSLCNNDFTLTLITTDGNSCTSSCTKTVNVLDNTAPVITAGTIASCYPTVADAEAAALAATSAIDGCPGSLTEIASTSGVCSAVVTITFTDACTNSSSVTYNTRIDNTSPVLTCPGNITINAGNNVCGRNVHYTDPSATDNCPGAITIIHTDGSGYVNHDFFPVGVTTQSFKATDGCGYTSTCSFTVTVIDDQDPIITGCPINIGPLGNDLNICGRTVSWTAPTASDNCPGVTLAVNPPNANGSTFPVGVTTVTYTATDASGRTAICVFTVEIEDTEAPAITCPSNIVQSNDPGLCTAVVNYTTPVGTDNCPIATTMQTVGLASGATYPLGVTTNTFKVTDGVGLMSTCSFTVTVNDTEFPTISCPSNIVKPNDLGVCGAIVTFTAPVGADNCPGAVTIRTTGLASGSTFPVGVTTITYQVTDGSGNVTTCSFTITVNDTEFPAIACPANIVKSNDPGLCSALVTYTAPVGTDNCSGAVTVQTAGLASNTYFPVGVTTNTFKVTDAAGHTTTCSFTVTVNDTEFPAITCPNNIVTSTNPGLCTAVVTYTTPVGTDNCPGAPTTQTAGLASGSAFPKGVTLNTFSITDASGNTTSCSFTVTVNDTEFPVIACPANIVQANDPGNCSAVVTYTTPVGTDNCPGAITVQTAGLPSGGTFPVGTTTNTFKVTDAMGNVTTCSFTVTVNDTQFPVISCPTNIVQSNDAGICGAIVTFTAPTGTDNCPGAVTIRTTGLASGSTFPVGVTTNTYQVTDASGNVTTCSFTITVNDTELPAITCPSNIVKSNDAGLCSALVVYSAPVGTDNCSGSVTVQTAGLASNTYFPLGVTTNTFKVTDASGNMTTCSFTVTVNDTEFPVISCPNNIVISTDAGLCTALVTYSTPTGTDNCPGAVTTQTSGLASGSAFPKGITTNTFKVTDAAGNMTTCSFTVTVNDTEFPVIACPSNIVKSNDIGVCGAVVTYSTPVGTDNCPGSVTVQTAGLASGATYPIGVTTNTFKVTDAMGNTTTCSFTVTVNDTEFPAITCPANIVKSNDVGFCSAVVTYTTPVGTDNCPGSVTVQIAGLASGAAFPIGVTTNTYQVTDASGNVTTCSFTVTVNDTQFPVIACPSNIVQSNDPGICGAIVIYTAPVGTDNCPGAVTVQTAGLPSASIFPVGITTNTFKVTDASGNVTTCSFTVTVNDTEFPVISCPNNIVISTDAGLCTALVTYSTPTGTDNCPGAVTTQTSGLPSGSAFPKGITTNTFKVTDAAGNMTTCSFTVTVNDTELPVIACPSNIVQSTDAGICSAVVTYATPVGTDNCPGAVTVQTSGLPSGAMFPKGITTNTFKVTDAMGNTSTCSFTVTVNDTEFPVISCPSNIVQSNDVGFCSAAVTYTAPVGTDNCPGSVTVQIAGLPSGSNFPIGVTTNTFKVTDASGNVTTCSFTVTVNDTQFPVIYCPSDIVTPNDANLCSALVTYTPPVGTDNCPGSVTVQIAGQPSGTYFPVGVTTNTFKVTDASGNVTTCSFTVTVNDTQFPVITCPSNITMGTDPGLCSAVVTFAATATDNCPGTVITYSKNPGTVFSIGSTIVTAYATDAAGNSSQCTFFVTVVDTEKPVVTCIGNLTKGTDAPTCTYTAVGTVLDPATQSDNCGITMTTYTLTGVTTGTGMTTLAGVVFNKGITNIKWKVKDAAGNVDSCTFVFTVVDDDAPSVTCVENQSRGTTAPACSYTAVGAEFNPTASSDNCGITATAYTLSGATTGSGSNTLAGVVFNNGMTTVEWQVSDAAGNTATCSFVVTVTDDDAPVISCKANQTRGTDAPTCAYTAIGTEFDLASATDNCGITQTEYKLTGATTSGMIVISTLAGVTFNKGTTVVTWKVTDAVGNTATCKFNVKVVDDDAPTIVCKTNQSRGTSAPLCNYTTVGTEFDLMSSSDNCGVISSTTYTLSGATSGSGSNSLATFVFVKGVTTIKWTVTDPAGNTSTCSFTVTIADDDAPSLVCKANQTRGTTTPACKYTTVGTEFNLMSSSDNCGVTSTTYTLSGATTGTGSSSLAGKIFNTGVTTIVWKVSDAAGNMNTCSLTVTVNDNILPTLTCKSNQTRSAAPYTCKYTTVGAEFNLTASSDNCGITSTTYTLTGVTTGTGSTTLAGVMFNKGVSTVTWKVTDAAGNSKTCSFTVTVNDVDSDCDGVFDCTDVCPGGDDTVDNDGNSLPDCKYPPSYAEIIPAWKCGANKAYICHSGSTQCVNKSLIAGHIAHGDYLGPCDNANCSGWSLISDFDEDINTEAELEKEHLHELGLPNVMEVYPNPARNKMFVKLPNHGLAPIHIQVYNSMGKQMFNDIFDLKAEQVVIPINVLEFPSGLYYIKATVDGVEQVKTVSINK